RACGDEPFDAAAVPSAIDVRTRAAGEQPWADFAPAFNISACRQRSPAGDAIARELAAAEREPLARLAISRAQIGADLDTVSVAGPAHGRVAAPAEGRRLVLFV